MSHQALWDALHAAKVRMATPTVEDTEIDCRECAGNGTDGPDGPPCQYCDGSGVW